MEGLNSDGQQLNQYQQNEQLLFSSPAHHLASVVVRLNLFQKSSPLKVLDQWKPNLV